MRIPIVAANWKMNLGRIEKAAALVRRIRYPLNQIEGVEVVLCPPFTVLATLAEMLQHSRIRLGAQTMHWEEAGAYTGEISPTMLTGICQYVIVGHSERRSGRVLVPDHSAESVGVDGAAVNLKTKVALSRRLTPIICVGENLACNQAGETHDFTSQQVNRALEGLSETQASRCVIAYEPIWAIGSGKAATPADANRTIGLAVRGAVADTFGEKVAQVVRILYGGSVNVENIGSFVAMPDIDGALVGGASLKPDFVELVRRASTAPI